MTQHTCALCGAAITGDQATICRDCTDTLATDLRHAGGWYEPDPHSPIRRRWIPGLLHDLLTTGTRMDVAPRTAPDNTDDAHTLDNRYPLVISEAPSPANLAALNAYRQLRDVIATAARNLTPLATAPPARGHTCLWLTDHLNTIRRHDWSATLADDLHTAVDHAERLVDHDRRAVAVACTCGRRITIDPALDLIKCPCGEYGTVRWWIDNYAPAQPDGPITLVNAKTWLLAHHEIDVEIETLRTWAKRGELTEVSRDDRECKLYDHLAILHLVRRKKISA